jgi:outer membrane protein OmpA-like peptidoglycan-associated protein
LSVTARTNLPGHSPSYRWTVDGTPVGENSPTFTYTPPQQSGRHVVAVTVTDNPGTSQDTRFAAPVTRELLTATVRDLQPPTISGSANPSTLVRGAASSLTVTPQGGTCGGQVTYTCRADEGTLSGTPPSRFDSTNVAFDMADRSREQSKTVNIVCTATDAKGGTANATLPVVVTLPAELTSRRFDDVVFPAGNSRVNNCGKRILLEEVVTQLNDHPDWDLVVVGHTAPGERAPSRNAALDRERALNVIATLTAGTDTCAKIDLSRVKVALVGAESKSEPRPAFCGTSTRLAAVERPGQATAVNTANAARRVEIYLVPRGGKLPDAADNYEVVPASMLGARGCPK